MKTKSDLKFKIILLSLAAAILFSASCTSKRKVISDDFAVDSAEAGLSDEDLTLDAAPSGNANTDEFSDFDATATAAAPKTDIDSAANIEKELNDLSANTTAEPVVESAVESPVPPVEIVQQELPVTPPVTEITEAPVVPEPVVTSSVISKITNVQYKGNSNGGTIVISSDSPLTYTTRVNTSSNQVVIEIQNTVVANQFKRPLNTKDMSSSIGHVDVYQKKDSMTARFVVQLRPNSPEPLVQPEGNSLLIIGSAVDGSGPNPNNNTSVVQNNGSSQTDSISNSENNADLNTEMTALGIMKSDDLEEFLSGNNKFYGKKISIETTDMDVRDILKFISEESGVNMVFDDDVNGKSSLKLRKVPWDQALVILLKSKRFGYRRQGSILRIAKVENLMKEDENAIKLKESKAVVEPLIVKNFSINYADIDKLETKIKDFIAENKKDVATRGKVTSDARTSMLIVTETASKLDQIGKLIKALDTQPQQVMIEARIIEANDTYTRSIGGSIGANRAAPGSMSIAPGQNIPNFSNSRIVTPAQGTNYESPSLNVSPSGGVGQSGSFVGNLFFGTLGAFGNLDAQLALDEIENKVKILSSPRVAVLTNTTATINQGATILQKQAETATAGSTTSTVTFTPVKVGVNLKVTPQISNIGTVRLQLDVNRTSVVAGSTTTDDRSVKTEVIVKNGDTAVIGGVFQSDVVKESRGVPGLKDIPILGTLFKGDSTTNTKTELMIFVTPKIIPLINQIFKADNEITTEESKDSK